MKFADQLLIRRKNTFIEFKGSVKFKSMVKNFLKGKNILEISPCFFPVIEKNNSYNLDYCDRISYSDLVEREKNNQYRIDNNAQVLNLDFQWPEDQRLVDCTKKKYDLITSSHVIEHVPNYIDWLHQHYEILNVGGEVRLIIPNAHKSGEFIRRLSSASLAYEYFLEKRVKPSPSQVFDGLMSITEWNGKKYKKNILDYKRWYTYEEAVRIPTECNDRYIDLHCWAWTAESFYDDFMLLKQCNLLPFEIVNIEDGESIAGYPCDEFSVILKKVDNNFSIPSSIKNYWDKNKPKSSKFEKNLWSKLSRR